MADELPHQHYLHPYREALATHGPTFAATLWRSREAQLLRFDVLIDLVGPGALAGASILDAGCGRGDFAQRLVEREVEFDRYIGVDGIEELVASASERDIDRAVFEVGDFVTDHEIFHRHRPDYVLFCGSLNTLKEEEAMEVVRRAFEAANHGVALNFLGDRHHRRWRGEELAPARRFSTVRWLDMALSLSSRVVFDQEYLDGHDASLLIRHEG